MPESTRQGGAAEGATGGTVREHSWHQFSETFANGRVGPGIDPTSLSFEDIKRKHDAITKGCGHPIVVTFDWASLPIAEWVDNNIGAGRTLNQEDVTGYCVGEVLGALGASCENAQYRSATAHIKTVTCHGKPCDALPRSSTIASDVSPGYVYALSADHTNVDVTFCVHSTRWTGSESILTAEQLLKENL